MRVEFEWNRSPERIIRDIDNDDTLLFLANECKRQMDPYVPADNSVLVQNVRMYVEDGQGCVEYLSPYAHYQYEGEVYGPNIPVMENGQIVGWWSPPHKYPTGRSLDYSKFRHPLATSHWDRAMVTAKKDDIARAVQAYLNRGGGR